MYKYNRAVFLDRDGVVNEVIIRDGEVSGPHSLEEFIWVEGIKEAVNRLKAASWYVFIITNQPDIARKKLDPIISEEISKTIYEHLLVDEIQVCPHDDHHNCACRKPRPGMLLSLAWRWKIALTESFMIGDSWKDIAAGQSAHCQTILLERYYNKGTEADFKVDTILSAVELILSSQP